MQKTVSLFRALVIEMMENVAAGRMSHLQMMTALTQLDDVHAKELVDVWAEGHDVGFTRGWSQGYAKGYRDGEEGR